MSKPAPEHRYALALLAAEADRARAGLARPVLLRGATGTGRTTVLEAAAAAAAAQGMLVLRARCSPGHATVPFAAARQLLSGLPGQGPGTASDDQRTSEREQGARWWRELRAHAAEQPLFLAVDDVHLADAPSQRWFVEVARQVDGTMILLTVTERNQYDVDPPQTGFAHTLSPALLHTHTLPLLTNASASARARSAFPDASESWIQACVRAGTGSPLLLQALLADLGDSRHATVPEACAELYPAGYPAAVSWWLDCTGPTTAELARALAALDEGWDHGTLPAADDDCFVQGIAGLLAELAGADPARVSGWLTAMTGLGLLRRDPAGLLRYAHPLLRDAVLTGVPVARRRAAHRSAAEVMLRRGAPTDFVARQLLLSDPVGTAWALAVLRDATIGALREGRAEEAVVLLRRTLEEPLSEVNRQRMLTELGSLEYMARQSSAGIPRLAEAVQLPGTPHNRVRAAMALSTALADRGKPHVAVDMLRTLDGQLVDRPDLVGTLDSARALLSDHDSSVRREAYRLLHDAAEHSPQRLGPAEQALLVRYASTAGLISAKEAMRQIRVLLAQPVHALTEPFLLGTAAAVAQWAEELDEADRLVERGLVGRRSDLLHPMHGALLDTRADIAAARGDFAPLLMARDVPGTDSTNARAHAIIAYVETDRLREAEHLVDSFDSGRATDGWRPNRFLYARGMLRAAAGDPVSALHDFLECGGRQSNRDVFSPVVTPWRSAAAECHLTLGSPREALVLVEEELRLAQVWGTARTVGRALRVKGTTIGGRGGLELTTEAVRLLRETTARTETELVAALIAQGQQLASLGEQSRSRESLREASERAERLGAVRHRGLAERALREGGARRVVTARTGSASLTGSERRIAGLAAEGRTNAEIADLLHLARRTVETHLTSSYRKLGIRRRGELGRVLHG